MDIVSCDFNSLSALELEQLVNALEEEKQRIRTVQKTIQAELTRRAHMPRPMSINDGAVGTPSLVAS